MSKSTLKVASLGAGTIGRSWAVAFARAGYRVHLYDPFEEIAARAVQDVVRSGSVRPDSIVPTSNLAEAVADSVYIQESGPENVEVKRQLFEAVAAVAGDEAIFGSSTSTLPGSSFLLGLPLSERSLIVHPTNPPHVVPLTELCRTPETSDATFDRTWRFLEDCGQTPVEILREVFGFALNRLQAALVSEALDLVAGGVISAPDLDRVVTHGLGLRWALTGPFETGHLNAPDGYYQYMSKFRSAWEALFRSVGRDTAVDLELVSRIDAELRETLGPDVAPRQARRDRLLMRLREVLEPAAAPARPQAED